MATKKKLLQAAAGAAGGEALNVEEVFSTYVYDGNGSTQTITNDIDLSGEGGFVWIKIRSALTSHQLYDTERGATQWLLSDDTSAQITYTSGLTAFNSDGFTVSSGVGVNGSTQTYVSWAFRKAPKFFDVVTYTGDGTSATSRNIPHNLGCAPGFIVLKRLDSATNWEVNALNSSGSYERLRLNLTSATSGTQTGHTDTTFHTITSSMNVSGGTYVAYLFAHNDGDGGFGPDGDADIIKCGSYTATNNDSTAPEINLGFEPQFLLVKNVTSAHNWYVLDTMRGIPSGGTYSYLNPNLSDAEATDSPSTKLTATGFIPQNRLNIGSSNDYIYIAIRRGPMAVPESATDVFAIDTANSTGNAPPWMYSGWPVDLGIHTNKTGYATNARVVPRLTSPNYLYTSSNSAEISADTTNKFDYMDGYNSGTFTSTDFISWMWRRAPNYFDVVCYTGNGTAGHTVSHNLGVAPEMMWVKARDLTAGWNCYLAPLGATKYLELDNTNIEGTATDRWNDTEPTDTVFTLGTRSGLNQNNNNYIAYLFASLDGVSKVGSYTGNGTSDGDTQDINCGFTSGARFVLIKRTSSTGNWMLYDTERGIVSSGDDKRLELNGTSAQDTNENCIEPLSSGFTVRWDIDSSASNNPNISGSTYIFYAIA